MSFGTTTDSEILHQAVKAAEDAGVLMIAAAGNRGESDKQVEYPAAYPEVLAVGATGTDAELSGISSDGEEVEVLAPGENVAVLGIWDEVNLMDGTSLSTAEVTGAASVLLSMDKSKSPEFIRGLLNTASNQNAGTGNAGIVDLSYAISVYNEFAGKFQEQVTDGIINTREVKTYDEEDVKASWQLSYHESVLNSFGNLTKTQSDIVKKGLQYPDQHRFGMSVQPLSGFDNYIGNYIYLGRLARYTYNNSLNSALENVVHPLGKGNENGDACISTIKAYMGYLNSEDMWPDILGYDPAGKSAKVVRADQAYFIIGMTIHGTMDAYAHRGHVDGVSYDGAEADKTTLTGSGYTQAQKNAFALRWTVAKAIAREIMEKWQSDESKNFQGIVDFSAEEFYLGIHSPDSFTMQKFETYAKSSDGSKWSGRSSSFKTFFQKRTTK